MTDVLMDDLLDGADPHEDGNAELDILPLPKTFVGEISMDSPNASPDALPDADAEPSTKAVAREITSTLEAEPMSEPLSVLPRLLPQSSELLGSVRSHATVDKHENQQLDTGDSTKAVPYDQEKESKGNDPDRLATAASSPLTDIPDLPSRMHSPLPALPTALDRFGGALHAESSAQAAKRAKSGGKTKTGASRKRKDESDLDDWTPSKKTTGAGGSGRGSTAKRAKRVILSPLDDEESQLETVVDEDVDEGQARGEAADSLASLDEALKQDANKSGKKKRKAESATDKTEKSARVKVKSDRGPNMTDAKLRDSFIGKTVERQVGKCQKPRYVPWGKCTQCVAKAGGDSCRFQGFRLFPIEPSTGEINGPGYFESVELEEAPTSLPTEFNTSLQEHHIVQTEKTAAPVLLPLITRELRHVVQFKAIKRGVDAAKHRGVCDFCSSTIFAGYFFCRKCGRDYCLSCERMFCDSQKTMDETDWRLLVQNLPRLLRCSIGSETSDVPTFGPRHFRGDLQAVSRFSEDELRRHWTDLAEFGLKGPPPAEWSGLFGFGNEEKGRLEGMIDKYRQDHPEAIQPKIEAIDTSPQISALYTNQTHPTAPLPEDPAGLSEQSLKFMRIPYDQLDNAFFDKIWARGEPIVVDHVESKLKEKWTPDAMIERFGTEECGVTDCERNATWSSTVRQFFERFKDADNRPAAILKLKDWPATKDFKATHPGLYDDFCDALPVPDYTRREGVMNMYAHFPPGPTRPDIGPKMYNAFAAREGFGGHGSTRLHMDVADAINVMLYASDRPLPKKPKRAVVDGVPAKAEPLETRNADVSAADAWEQAQSQIGPSNPPAAAGGTQVGREGVVNVISQGVNEQTLEGTDSIARDSAGDRSTAPQLADMGTPASSPSNEFIPAGGSGTDPVRHQSDSSEPSKGPHQALEPHQQLPATAMGPGPQPLQNQNQSRPMPAPDLVPEVGADGPTIPHPNGIQSGSLVDDGTTEPREPGCAVWDVYRAEDADKLRAFLSKKYDSTVVFNDPIHSQLFYLNANQRRELWQTMGVASFRIYQYPGQAVFIPAGCAHQVCNLADCIKIALDFVSPHNVPRCQQLMGDFRNENLIKAWKDDVLQLYNILWFAWLSSRETRERRIRSEAEQKANIGKTMADLDEAQHRASSGNRAVMSSLREETGSRPGSGPNTPSKLALPHLSAVNDDDDSARTLHSASSGDQATKQLVAELLAAALSAPEPPAPSARPPSTATGSKWGLPAKMSKPRKPSSSAKASARDHSTDPKSASPLSSAVTAANGGTRRQSQRGKGPKASDFVRSGLLSGELAIEAIASQMGLREDDVEMDGNEVDISDEVADGVNGDDANIEE